jgi:hypothetical protein
MTDEVVKELYRSRWRRARETLGLVDPGQDGFATGGLGRHVAHFTARLLVLPADPEVGRIEFDEPLWDWWKGAHQSPFEGRPGAGGYEPAAVPMVGELALAAEIRPVRGAHGPAGRSRPGGRLEGGGLLGPLESSHS